MKLDTPKPNGFAAWRAKSTTNMPAPNWSNSPRNMKAGPRYFRRVTTTKGAHLTAGWLSRPTLAHREAPAGMPRRRPYSADFPAGR